MSSYVESSAPGRVKARQWTWRAAAVCLFGISVLLTYLISTRFSSHFVLKIAAVQLAFFLPSALLYFRSARHDPAGSPPVRRLSPVWLVAAYLAIVFPLAWIVNTNTSCADESAYRFQARIFLTGHLMADAPPASETVNGLSFGKEFFFHHLLLTGGKWFSKYPPGWPMALMLPIAFHLDWLLNPMLGLVILFLTYRIGAGLFDTSTGWIAALVLLASPFFIFNSLGFMSHPLCSALLAGATLLFFRWLRTASPTVLIGMLALITFAFWVRPFTAGCAGIVFAVAALWHYRRDRVRLKTFILAGAVTSVAAAGVLLWYNSQLTGHFLVSPYALYFGTNMPPEVDLRPAHVLSNLFTITRSSFEKLNASVFPLLLLLAAYALLREERAKREAIYTLGALFLILVFGYTGLIEPSDTIVGERMYYEAFFALSIVAARGIAILQRRWRIPARAMAAAMAAAVLLTVPTYYRFYQDTMQRALPFTEVQNAINGLHLSDAVFFLQTAEGFKASDFNQNSPDWKHSDAFYFVDTGEQRRPAIAALMGKSNWAVISYDPQARAAVVEQVEHSADNHQRDFVPGTDGVSAERYGISRGGSAAPSSNHTERSRK